MLFSEFKQKINNLHIYGDPEIIVVSRDCNFNSDIDDRSYSVDSLHYDMENPMIYIL